MNDLISRQAAIEALERIFNFCEEIDAHLPEDEKSGYKMFPDYMAVRTFLTQLPSAEKHGKWIDTGSGQECSECREIQYGYDSGRNYYPNCGAKMERSEE